MKKLSEAFERIGICSKGQMELGMPSLRPYTKISNFLSSADASIGGVSVCSTITMSYCEEWVKDASPEDIKRVLERLKKRVKGG